MDASTFSEEDLLPSLFQINLFPLLAINNVGGGIIHSPNQKFYYYPFQDTKEVLIFHQYSKGKFFANPHGSFFNKNCPEDTKPRVSVELRVALYF